MTTHTRAPSKSRSHAMETGSFRLQIRMPRGWVRVGPFLSLTKVGNYADGLLDGAGANLITALKVEFRDRTGWHTAYSFQPERVA